ncbi:hypothetical protein LTR66_011027, partial [Elasticomyces elasticus]
LGGGDLPRVGGLGWGVVWRRAGGRRRGGRGAHVRQDLCRRAHARGRRRGQGGRAEDDAEQAPEGDCAQRARLPHELEPEPRVQRADFVPAEIAL